MTIKKYLTGTFKYDRMGQYIWLVDKKGDHQKIADLRGWGAIQHLFPMTEEGQNQAAQFQDELGEWIVNVLNKANGN